MVARVMIKPVFLVLQVIVVYFSAIRSGAWWVWVYSGPRNQDTGLRYAEADFEGTRDVETET